MWSVGLAVVAIAAVTLLWTFLGTGDPADASKLDAVRTASSIVLGAGGAAALLLAARRQRYVELDLEQKEHDANERRVTELYGKAADQLGSDKAPVRLAGVYALERLAQDDPRHRQSIVNLLCAYLRMSYAPDDDEEGVVRFAIQDIFERHLQPAHEDRFWPDIDLSLTNAHLAFFWFRDCRIREGHFRGATFHEIAAFRGTTFTATADFTRATFQSTADLRRLRFPGGAGRFTGARFGGTVDFRDTDNTDLTDATATPGPAQTWPPGWTAELTGTDLHLTRTDDPG